MKICPVCRDVALRPGYLETYGCPQCGGIWIATDERLTQERTELSSPNRNQATLCPDCDQILRPYHGWPNLAFQPDCCQACYGFWFNKEQWQTLKFQGLPH